VARRVAACGAVALFAASRLHAAVAAVRREVDLAALDHGSCTELRADRLRERLAAVDDEERRTVGADAASLEIRSIAST
jgi:hypothetical protein